MWLGNTRRHVYASSSQCGHRIQLTSCAAPRNHAAPSPPLQARIFMTIVRNLRFSPYVRRMASVIVAKLRAAGPFNAVHLRLEEDYRLFNDNSMLNQYIDAMRSAGFTASSQLYMVTGIYGDALKRAHKALLAANIGSSITGLWDFASPATLQTLSGEHHAAVNFLVMMEADVVVGFELSSFSFFAEQYRWLLHKATHNVQHKVRGEFFDRVYSFANISALAASAPQAHRRRTWRRWRVWQPWDSGDVARLTR